METTWKKVAVLLVLATFVVSVIPFGFAAQNTLNFEKSIGRNTAKLLEKTVPGFEEGLTINPSKLKGDVNGDGRVDVADLTLLSSYVTNKGKVRNYFVLSNADVNDDGQVNWNDVVELANQLFMAPGLAGDVNNDGSVDVSDMIYMTMYLNGRYVIPNMYNDVNRDNKIDWQHDVVGIANQLFMNEDEILVGDVNDDGRVDITDIAVLSHYLNGRRVMIDCQNADVFGEDEHATTEDITEEDLNALMNMLFGERNNDNDRIENRFAPKSDNENTNSVVNKRPKHQPQKRIVGRPPIQNSLTN